jgi:hypothetical protein
VITVEMTNEITCAAVATSNTITMSVTITSATQNALDFEGTDDYVALSSVPSIGSSQTVEMWVKVPTVGSGGLTSGERVGILFGNVINGNNISFGYEINAGGRCRIYWNKGEIDVFGNTDLRDNLWHHIAFVRDVTANEFYIYIDGVLDKTHNSSGTNVTFTDIPRIGGDLRPSNVPYFHGSIDDFRIWNTARTSAEINNNKNCKLVGNESDLILYYDFDQGVAGGSNSATTTLTDLTSNGNNGTLNNFALTGSTSNWVASTIAPDCSVLPVELTYFDAATRESNVLLTWQTATEENNEGFEVERSAEGRNWEILGFVQGQGTTIETQNYTFVDEEPTTGINYYRLKQMDFDGQFEYSDIRNVVFGNSDDKTMAIYPNPVQNELTISEGVGNITIFNALGQPIRQLNNEETLTTINTSDLPKGIYILQLQKVNGQVVTTQFVK